jgi:quinolinate synthase
MRQLAPDKLLFPAPVEGAHGCAACSECPHMKRNTLEKVYMALRDVSPRIQLDEDLRSRAEPPLRRMLELQ